MFGPMVEKAWAKISGSYSQYYGNTGLTQTWAEAAIRAMSNFPIQDSSPGSVSTDYTNLWTNLTDCSTNNCVMTASADKYASTATGCGLVNY